MAFKKHWNAWFHNFFEIYPQYNILGKSEQCKGSIQLISKSPFCLGLLVEQIMKFFEATQKAR